MKKMILLLLLLWLFTGCASTEQTVSEAESSDSEISSSMTKTSSVISEINNQNDLSEQIQEDDLKDDRSRPPWELVSPIKSQNGQLYLNRKDIFSYEGLSVGEYWLSLRWNCAERMYPGPGPSIIRDVAPSAYFDEIKDVGGILAKDYLIGFREKVNDGSDDGDASYQRRPKQFPSIECFLFQGGKFCSYPVEIWHQNDYSSDPPLEISYDPDTRTAEVSSILMTAKVQMDTGETVTEFSTERLQKANEKTQYGVYPIDEALLVSSDGKYEIGLVRAERMDAVCFSRNTETGEERYLANGYFPGLGAILVKELHKKLGKEEELYQTEKGRQLYEGASMDNIMRLDGYTLYFPYWDIAYNIETGEQVE